MFHFLKKDKDKNKEKKEKHEKKKKEKDEKQEMKDGVKNERQNLSPEEISRIEEMKRSILRRFSDKERTRSSHKYHECPSPFVNEGTGDKSSLAHPIPNDEIKELTKPHHELPSNKEKKEQPPTVLPKLTLKSIFQRKRERKHPATTSLDDARPLQENTKHNEKLFTKETFVKTASASVQEVRASISSTTMPSTVINSPSAIITTPYATICSSTGNPSSPSSFLNAPLTTMTSTTTSSKSGTINSASASESSPSATISTPSTHSEDLIYEEESCKLEPSKFNLRLPLILPPKPPRIRELQIQRLHAGGFGFSLRRSVIPRFDGDQPRMVTLAEPGLGSFSTRTGLLAGDRLVEINGQNVENISREEIVEIIKEISGTITLKVQPIPELIELSVRPSRDGSSTNILSEDTARSGSLNHKQWTRSEQDKSAKEWLETEKVWLMHRGGFSEAYLLKSESTVLPEGRVRVRLESGDIVEVDEEDVEKANPQQFDRSEDLAVLRYLNESSALHTLRQRYARNLIHTYAGPYLIVINPMQQFPIYTDKVIQMMKGCKQEDMPPHIFSMAQIIYRDMLNTRKDQSLLLMGKSGSGKTVNAQHVLRYLITAAGSVSCVLTVEKLNSVYTVLSAFGNSRTSLNVNASRFTQIFTVDFDHIGQIGSASVQVLMLEKSRVVRRPEGEQTFAVFYQLLAGADTTLRNDLHLHNLSEENVFLTSLQKPEDKEKAVEAWSKLLQAFSNLKFQEHEIKAILSVLAAICHLDNAGAVKGSSNRPQFAKLAAAQKAAALLGITVEELSKHIFSSGGASTLNRTASLRVSTAMDRAAYLSSDVNTTAQECLEGFIVGLYADLFSAVVSLINRSISSSVRTITSVTLVDCPGFQSSGAGFNSGRSCGATFEDLCHNYTQERLQAFFHEVALSVPQDMYEEEDIVLDFDIMPSSPSSMVILLDKPPQQGLMRTSTADMKNLEKKGLLWILDEEAMFPGATEDNFMDRLLQQHCEQPVRKDSLLRKGSLGHTFVLNHNLGMTPILYNAQGWLKSCRENATSRNASLALQDSKNVADLFTSAKCQSSGFVSGSIVGMEGSASLRRVSNMRRVFTFCQAGLKKKSICLQVIFTVDTIIDLLKKTSVHFVHCVIPHHFAGLGEQHKPPQDDSILNVPLVRNQLRGFQILDALRLYRLGFPDSMTFTAFINKFEPLVPDLRKGREGEGDEKMTVNQILDNLDIEKLNYRIGKSRVFFRPGCLAQLDLNRDKKFTGIVEKLQALCRGYLGRKHLKKLKVQQTAIRCVQRNVRKYIQIREWEWWKLFTKVKPILNVHRTEEDLKEKEAEIEMLKSRNEKLEKERAEYKTQCDKLENRLAEVSAELADENTTANEASELLEAETAKRMMLEKELRELQNKLAVHKRQSEKLQMEVMQTRLWQAESVDDELEEKEDDSVYKARYERVVKELQITKKQLQQQHNEEMEQELQSRKQVEKRLHETVTEAEEQRRQVQVAKKKAQRLTAEMQDLKLHLEEQMSRNNELERKQRRFDSEVSMAHEDAKEEKAMKDKLQRERDELLSQKYSLEQSLQHMEVEQQNLLEKCERLDKEMNDLLLTGKDNSEAVTLKRCKHELEMTIQEQEEELDDQAGKIQQLEQAKLRLEMNVEKSKQQHQKELEEKDEEVEEMRYKTQKKLRQLEDQLEEEYEQKKRIQEEKIHLERQLQAAGSRKSHRDRESEKRLKHSLRKTKALLHDAWAALLKQKDIDVTKAQISVLRNQLEDAEFSSAAALKAKKRMELEMQELQQQLDDLTRAKQEAETKSMHLLREKADIQSRLEELEDDMNEVMKKYKAAVQQQSVDQITLTDQMTQIVELSEDRDRFKQEVSDLQTRLQSYDDTMVDKHTVQRLEMKIRDLESRLDLEATTRYRLESHVSRLKEQIERVTLEKDDLNLAKLSAEEANKRIQKQLRDLWQEFGELQKKEIEATQKKKELETRVDELEGQYEQNQSDLKLALKRITDLQAALEEGLDSDSDILVSDSDSDDPSIQSSVHKYGHTSRRGSSNRSQAPVTSSQPLKLSHTSEAQSTV